MFNYTVIDYFQFNVLKLFSVNIMILSVFNIVSSQTLDTALMDCFAVARSAHFREITTRERIHFSSCPLS